MVLGLILFNIFLRNLFLFLNDIDITCFADDNTRYKACDNVDAVVKTLGIFAEKLFNGLRIIKWKAAQVSVIWDWVQEIQIKSNLDIH